MAASVDPYPRRALDLSTYKKLPEIYVDRAGKRLDAEIDHGLKTTAGYYPILGVPYHGLKTTAGYYPILGVPYLDLKDPFCETTSTGLADMLRMFDAPVPVIHGPEDSFCDITSTGLADMVRRFHAPVPVIHGPEDPFCDITSTGLADMLRMFHAPVPVIHGPKDPFSDTTSTGLAAMLLMLDSPVSVIHGPKRLPWNIKNTAAASIVERMYQTKTLASFAPPATASGSMVANPGGAPVFENRFFLDSGAIFHAVGDGRMLRGIQPYSFGVWVEQPDGSPLRIVGVGTLQMDDPSVCGNHVRSYNIPNVRLVAGLQKNLISVGQLDRDHGLCCSFHSKKCEIMMADGTVTGGAILEEEDGMYVLRFLEVQ